AEAPASLECAEWGTLQIGDNRLIIGLVKRVHVREALFDPETLRRARERRPAARSVRSWGARRESRRVTRDRSPPALQSALARAGPGGTPAVPSSRPTPS
ncbi:MAG: hypothetical protein ACRENE_13320, partial [Polyangiaceae bacterium]